jgi:hypothetical protein
MKTIWSVLLVAITLCGCGTGVSYSTASGTVNILNGPTATSGLPKSVMRKTTTVPPLENGTYALAPSKMTLTVTGIAFLPVGKTQYDNVNVMSLSGCTATYDRSVGSLAVLNTSDISVPCGTYCGVAIRVRQTYTMVINDTAAGIYSDPAVPSHLSTTAPAGGGQPIQIRDQNSDSDGEEGACGSATYFDSPITVDKDARPQVYVVFDPTHWIKASYNNGSFDAPRMGGNPPIVPSISNFGKAAYYNNMGTTMAYRMDGHNLQSGTSLLFLYADITTPITVTWQVHDICVPTGGSAVVAYNGNGMRAGLWGMLGLDANHMLAWASPAPSKLSDGTITGYSGVFRMPEISTVGQTTVLSYKCMDDVPRPISGRNYSSGAPDFTADGTLTLTLLAN